MSCTTRHTHVVIVAEMGIAPIQTKNSSDPYQLRPIPMCTHNITLRLAMPSCPCIRVVLLVDVSHVELSHVKTAFCVCLCVSSGTSAPQVVLCMFHWLPYTCYRVAYANVRSLGSRSSHVSPLLAGAGTRNTTARGLSAGSIRHISKIQKKEHT